MDILDIILGSALTPQGEIESFAARAEKAVQDASQALSNIESITQQTNTNNLAAEQALQQVQNALQELDTVGNLQDIADVEIDKLVFSLTNNSGNNFIASNLSVQYPNDDTSQLIGTCVKYYTGVGQNNDGTMTQKAITDAINTAVNNIDIPKISNINLGAANAGKVVIVDTDGSITASATATEDMILNGTGGGGSTNPSGPTVHTGIVGIRINYTTGTSTPTNDAINATTADFDNLTMYGGRKKCLVNDSGEIVAFYGDNNYTDTPSNGYQVMVYQPKFYYRRNILQTSSSTYGTIIKEELLQLSATERNNFKIHPLFLDQNNNVLDYVLLSAYEGSIESATENSYKDVAYRDFINQKLSSVSGAKPIGGANNEFTVINAEHLAQNRGDNWHILNMRAISAMQMLELVEFGTLNGQTGFNEGICRITNEGGTLNQAATTGSTNSLGNLSGQATSTTFEYNNEQYVESVAGKCAISYRGYENPWGNTWQFVGGMLIDNTSNKHTPYICFDYNYNLTLNSNYQQLAFTLPGFSGWVSGFGYDPNYDWIFLPIDLNDSANSFGPIGDYFFGSTTSGSQTSCCICGGPWFAELNVGPFYYAFNWNTDNTLRSGNARLMLIPQYNSNTYLNNIDKWNTNIGG